MADMTFPQTFVKGDRAIIARNASDAVKAKFEGFKPKDSVVLDEGPDYRDLQAMAKERGIPANQSKEDLVEALRAPENAEPGPEPVLADDDQ